MYETSRLATHADAMREFAENCEAPANQAWISTPYDVWVRNPRYRGPDVPHPEEYDYECSLEDFYRAESQEG